MPTDSRTEYMERSPRTDLTRLIREHAHPIHDLNDPDLDSLMDRIGDARVVLLGEATHGSREFYEFRGRITENLIRQKGFNLVAFEADWPDMESVNAYIHGRAPTWSGFARFPEWMWRNRSFSNFADGLRDWNRSEKNQTVSVYGLDLYSLSNSLHAVMSFLEQRDSHLAEAARSVQGCLRPWLEDPTLYGLAVWQDQIRGCKDEVAELLRDMHEQQMKQAANADPALFSALQNTIVVASAEEYYRKMYESSIVSWNHRDTHMFKTLQFLLDYYGPDSRIVAWEHNSHIGNAAATDMGAMGEYNLGQLCRNAFGTGAYLIGFGTDHGTVAAASRWDGPMQVKALRPALDESYEALMHETSVADFLLPLRNQKPELIDALREPRLERAVGVLYIPQTERSSHYFHAVLPDQFDEYVWIDKTSAVEPTGFVPPEDKVAETFPFGL